MNKIIKLFFGAIPIILLFIGVSYIVQTNIEILKELILGNQFWGITIYIFLEIIATVIAPLTTIPLIPLISAVYGWFWAGVITYVGWLAGAIIVFYISRKWGKPFVRKFMSLKEIESMEKSVSRKKKIWTLIFLRMTIPADILSYALGLFSSISWKTYIISTVIGIIPFTFLLAYIGSIPFIYQLLAFLVIGIIITIVVLYKMTESKKNHHLKNLV